MGYFIYVNDIDQSIRASTTTSGETAPPLAEIGEQCIEVSIEKQLQYENYLWNLELSKENIAIFHSGNMQIIEKPEIPCAINKTEFLANRTDLIIISDIPANSLVKVFPVSTWKVDDGIFEFTTTATGPYIFTVSNQNFKSKEFTINAS